MTMQKGSRTSAEKQKYGMQYGTKHKEEIWRNLTIKERNVSWLR